jgi:hypothetical protein
VTPAAPRGRIVRFGSPVGAEEADSQKRQRTAGGAEETGSQAQGAQRRVSPLPPQPSGPPPPQPPPPSGSPPPPSLGAISPKGTSSNNNNSNSNNNNSSRSSGRPASRVAGRSRIPSERNPFFLLICLSCQRVLTHPLLVRASCSSAPMVVPPPPPAAATETAPPFP